MSTRVSKSSTESRDWIAKGFTLVEDVVYISLAILLAGAAVVLLIDVTLIFGRGLLAGELPARIVGLLDQILLVLMIVELLYTVQVSFREHALIPEPFIIVGLIAATRRILVLTAEFAKLAEAGAETFRNAMIELTILTLMVVALVASLIMLRRRPPHAVADRS